MARSEVLQVSTLVDETCLGLSMLMTFLINIYKNEDNIVASVALFQGTDCGTLVPEK